MRTNASRKGPRKSTPATPLDVVMRILARRAHGRTELTRKLLQRGIERDEADTAIDRAIELGLMEQDGSIAERYAAELAGKRGATPRWVSQKLAARGLPQDAVRSAVERAFAEWDARAAALEYAGAEENRERAARRLERRGFPADVIGWTVRRLQSDPEEI